jgi:hypothetical protein
MDHNLIPEPVISIDFTTAAPNTIAPVDITVPVLSPVPEQADPAVPSLPALTDSAVPAVAVAIAVAVAVAESAVAVAESVVAVAESAVAVAESAVALPNIESTESAVVIADPNINHTAELSPDINCTHVIITRFSYRFHEHQPIGNLFDTKRLKRRFQLFKAFCFPSMINQVDKEFYWILVIDRDLPVTYLNQLYQLVTNFYQSPSYAIKGPRKIFVHKWQYTNLSTIEWLRPLIAIDQKKYLMTTRLDDDDSLCKNFTKMVKEQHNSKKIRGFFLISFADGYYWYDNAKTKYGIYKPVVRPHIAIGLTLIVELEKYPMNIYFDNHTRLVYHIRNYSRHRLLKRLCDRNNEVITEKNYQDKFIVVKGGDPVFIRTVHDQNLQRGMKNRYRDVSGYGNNYMQVNKAFRLNLRRVRKLTTLFKEQKKPQKNI